MTLIYDQVSPTLPKTKQQITVIIDYFQIIAKNIYVYIFMPSSVRAMTGLVETVLVKTNGISLENLSNFGILINTKNLIGLYKKLNTYKTYKNSLSCTTKYLFGSQKRKVKAATQQEIYQPFIFFSL